MIQKKNEKKKSARKDSPRCSFPLPFRLHALAAAALYLISPLPGVFADHTAIDLFTLALQPLAAWAAVAEPDPLAAVFQLSGRCSDHRRVSAALAVRAPCAVCRAWARASRCRAVCAICGVRGRCARCGGVCGNGCSAHRRFGYPRSTSWPCASRPHYAA